LSGLIEKNAFRILGLDISANQKEILKRYKEIINRLKIADFPEYDLDLNLPKDFRTEETVTDALKRLQNSKNNLVESFFWFQIRDTVDENALGDLRNNNFDGAIMTWKNSSETDNSTGLLYKKNLNLLYCLTLQSEDNDDYLNESLQNWNEIIKSDKFWNLFEKTYAIINEQTSNSELINEFRNNVEKYISDIYTEFYEQHKNPKYVKQFQEIIGAKGDKIEKTLLQPIHQEIYETISELKKINFESNLESIVNNSSPTEIQCENCQKRSSANPDSRKKFAKYRDGSILCKECHKTIGKEWQKKIKENETVEGSAKIFRLVQISIKKLESQLEKLREIGLYEDPQSKVVRDHVADAIRNASVMLHNDAHMVPKSIELLDLAKKISSSSSAREKMNFDLKDIKEFKETNETDGTLVLEKSEFFRKQKIIINTNFMEYKKTRIYVRDVTNISYYGEEGNYLFNIGSSSDKIDLKFSSRDMINQVINYAAQYIEPIIVEKLVKSIFEKDNTVSIGKVDFDKRGYHKSKILRGVESVLWTDPVYPAKLFEGNAILYKDKNGFMNQFASIPFKNPNAPVVPELINACFNEYHMRNPS